MSEYERNQIRSSTSGKSNETSETVMNKVSTSCQEQVQNQHSSEVLNNHVDDGVEEEVIDLKSGVKNQEENPEDLVTPLVGIESEVRNRKRVAHLASDLIPTSKFYANRQEKFQECYNRALEIQRNVLRNTITLMNFLAKVLFWFSLVAMAGGVVWYSRELAENGTNADLIAWFSAGAFVILGFPISIYGILMHLTNYYQPNVQCYVVRILWMVPIYSIESWLCLRYHEFALYIETLRDCYESFVLYCFLQFLIEVLGGEETLIMLLKDKSPTRGIHIWGMGFCIKPWLMGQPLQTEDEKTGERKVRWTSPFFKNCKLGCLQYVLLKLVTTIFVVVLEKLDLYKEGDFSPKFGYLYICILTNISQCWALYCLVFFYYATKNELGPIRPVGKFIAVKSLVFFTWWQSVGIAFLNSFELIPDYTEGGWTTEEVAKGLQAYLICIEMFAAAVVHIFVFPHTDYTTQLAVSISQKNVGVRNLGRRLGRRVGRRYYSGGYKDDKSYCSKTSDAASYMNDFDSQGSTQMESTELPKKYCSEAGYSRHHVERMTVIADDAVATETTSQSKGRKQRTGFVNALIDSAIPSDVMENTVGIARGDFRVEKKTLLYHAAASDEYSLFAKRRRAIALNKPVPKHRT